MINARMKPLAKPTQDNQFSMIMKLSATQDLPRPESSSIEHAMSPKTSTSLMICKEMRTVSMA